jgi:hypothetical protein
MISDHYKETKLQLTRLGKMDSELEKLMKECIKDLDETVEYEKLFTGKQPKVLTDTTTAVTQNTRNIVSICANCIRNDKMNLTTRDIMLIQQKLAENDKKLNEFKTLLRQIIK